MHPAFSAAIFPSFVVGPGFPPVPSKLVAAIVSGEFVDLASLLEDPIEPDAPSFPPHGNQLEIRPTQGRKKIKDILTRM